MRLIGKLVEGASTQDFVGQDMVLDYLRDIFARSSAALKPPGGALPARTEPAINRWTTST